MLTHYVLCESLSICVAWYCTVENGWEAFSWSVYSLLYSILSILSYIFSLFSLLSIISIPSWSVFGLWRCGRSCRSRRPLKSCMLIMLHLLVYLRSQRREFSHTCTMLVLWKEDVVCRVALTECVRLDILEIGRSQRPQREMPLIGVDYHRWWVQDPESTNQNSNSSCPSLFGWQAEMLQNPWLLCTLPNQWVVKFQEDMLKHMLRFYLNVVL